MHFASIAILLCGVLLVVPARADNGTSQDPSVENGGAAEQAEQGAAQAEDELLLGQAVFHQKCMKCHRSGRDGAPVRDRPADWRDRLTQSTETLIQHAIEGHTGERGTMPPGGGLNLSDEEIAAAVRYVIGEARQRVKLSERTAVCKTQPCEVDATELMLIQLL